jgi:hypothetical protein
VRIVPKLEGLRKKSYKNDAENEFRRILIQSVRFRKYILTGMSVFLKKDTTLISLMLVFIRLALQKPRA